MLELVALIISIIIIFIIILYKDKYNKKQTNEGFTLDNYYMSSCPTSFKSYYDNNGNIMCCNGDVIANRCISDIKCSLTSITNPDSCIKILLDEYKQKANKFCPQTSMPNYYEKGNEKGCTNGLLNSSMDGPSNSSQPKCKIYSDENSNLTSLDSCFNQKRLDDTICFGSNCSKNLVNSGANLPILIGVSFNDNNGLPHMAFTRDSYEDYLNVINPNWREQGIDLSKNLSIAEVAKAYYIDRTLQQSDINF
jgi:hypothetical protein